jgi:hypothetical protein
LKIRPIFERIKKRFDIKNRRQVVGIFFLAWVLIGLCLYQQYGISLDERVERQNGMVSLIHIGNQFGISAIQNNASLDAFRHFSLETYHDRIFGVFFSVTSAFFERVVFNIGDSWNEQAIFQFRHLETFLICVLGGYALFRLSERRFGDWRIGLLTLSFFILSPRFFGESFYNNKDLIFSSFFFISLNASIALLTKPTWLWAIGAGIAGGITVDIRVSGFILPAITLTLILVQLLQGQIRFYKLLTTISIYLVSLFAIVIAFWPWLWPDPVSRLLEAIQAFSRFTRSDTPMLFMGQQIRSTNLPWFYLPVWIAITTPVLYIGLFGVGAAHFLIQYFNTLFKNLKHFRLRLWSSPEQMQDLVFMSVAILPVLGIIVLNSVAYDGWRHVYFIYPAFLLIATQGWVVAWRLAKQHKPFFSKVLIGILTISFISTSVWIIRAHPLQNVYFNVLARTPWKDHYELDYWAVSSRQALEYIAKHDDRPLIKVNMGSIIFFDEALKILKPSDTARFIEAEWEGNADYILTNYRPNPINYRPTFTDFKGETSGFMLWHEVKVDGQTIAAIYRRRGDLPIVRKPLLHERIDFSTNGVGRVYLLDLGRSPYIGWGWSNPEAWGTWSDGEKARIAMLLPEDKNIQSLSLEVITLVSPTHPYQNIEILVNGIKQQDIRLSSKKIQKITIHASKLHPNDGYLLVEFHFPDRISPKELGQGADERKLGIGLVSAYFD